MAVNAHGRVLKLLSPHMRNNRDFLSFSLRVPHRWPRDGDDDDASQLCSCGLIDEMQSTVKTKEGDSTGFPSLLLWITPRLFDVVPIFRSAGRRNSHTHTGLQHVAPFRRDDMQDAILELFALFWSLPPFTIQRHQYAKMQFPNSLPFALTLST